MEADPERWLPGDRLGELTIVRRIAEGQGTFGVLHLVRSENGQARVLKSLNDAYRLAPDWIEKFEREIQLHRSLSPHPHIVNAVDSFDAFGTPHLLLEYCALGTVQDAVVASESGLSPTDIVRILQDLCLALDSVHVRHIVFGDLNPLNVLLVNGPQRPIAKLTDFGVARPAGRHLPPGLPPDPDTPGEMHSTAPERYEGVWLPASDIYALGVLGFALLTRKMPYDVDEAKLSPSELRRRFMELHLSASIPNLVSLRPEVPPALGELIARCMSKKPANRPRNAKDVYAELSDSLAR